MEIKIVRKNIVDSDCDAIVNAANRQLLAGSGVCYAIFKGAGKEELQKECDTLSPIKTGEAVITKGYNLKAKYVIHAVGPKYYENSVEDNKRLLRDAYLNSLKLADSYKLKSIAFPSISTGVYGYPKEEACLIALDTVKNYKATSLELVELVCFEDDTYNLYLEKNKCTK